jgi:hypothetical protein
MKRTDKEIVSAMEFIKSQHNGELPYKFGTFECAKMMAKYHAKQSSITAVGCQREQLMQAYKEGFNAATDALKEANKAVQEKNLH